MLPGPPFSAAYIAAVAGSTPHAIEQEACRLRTREPYLQSHPAEALDAVLNRHLARAVYGSFPTPLVRGLASDLGSALVRPPPPDADALVEAGLLHHCGTPVNVAAAALLLSESALQKHVQDVSATAHEMQVRIRWLNERAPLLSSFTVHSGVALAALITRYAHWITSCPPIVAEVSSTLRSTIDRRGSTLSVRSVRQLQSLAPLMKALSAIGFSIVFRLGGGAPAAGIQSVLESAAHCEARRHPANVDDECVARLAFLSRISLSTHSPSSPPSPERASPATYGRVGHLAIAGLVTAVHFSHRSTP